MSTILTPVAEAVRVEIVKDTCDEPYVLLDIQSEAGEPTRIRISREHIRHMANAFPAHAWSHPVQTNSGSVPSACVVIAARNVDILIDDMLGTAALALDPGSGLKLLVPLSGDLAERLAEIGRSASRYLRSLSRVRVLH